MLLGVAPVVGDVALLEVDDDAALEVDVLDEDVVVDELEDGSDDPPPDEHAASRMRGVAARAMRRFMR